MQSATGIRRADHRNLTLPSTPRRFRSISSGDYDETTGRVGTSTLASAQDVDARETTTATVTSEARDWSIMSNLAQAVSGMVSVGLKAVGS